jgi:hypothetical protein
VLLQQQRFHGLGQNSHPFSWRHVHQPVDVGRDTLALNTINMDGDRGSAAGITEPVDLVKPGGGKATIPGIAGLGSQNFGL